MQLTITQVVSLSTFVLYAASVRGSAVGVGNASDLDLAKNMAQEAAILAYNQGHAALESPSEEYSNDLQSIPIANADLENIYEHSSLSDNVKNLNQSNGTDIQPFTSQTYNNVEEREITKRNGSKHRGFKRAVPQEARQADGNFDPATLTKNAPSLVTDVVDKVIAFDKRNAVIPAIEILPGQGPAAAEFVNALKADARKLNPAADAASLPKSRAVDLKNHHRQRRQVA